VNGKRKRGWIIPLSVSFLFFGGVIPAMAGFIEKGSETLLKNGLKVIWIEDRRAPVVTFQVWYRAGARHDPWGRSGLAHVLEHMMFKGTEKIGADEFTRTIRENGGQYNAFTSYDFSGYFETLSSDRVRIAIELEADRMRNLVLREEDFQTERLVVMEERRLRVENDPQAVLREQVDAVAFLTQPYSRPVIGWMEDLARISMEDVRLFYERYYHPANAFLVVVGDFEKETLLQELEKSFGAIPAGVKPEHHRFQDPAPGGGTASGGEKRGPAPLRSGWPTRCRTSLKRMATSWP
jgi:zinc protease